MKPNYLYNLALAFDQFMNALLLGDPDESISGRTGRALASGAPKWWVPFLAKHIDWMFLHLFGERNHVANAVELNEEYSHELWSWKK
jgi:hypothetical protein